MPTRRRRVWIAVGLGLAAATAAGAIFLFPSLHALVARVLTADRLADLRQAVLGLGAWGPVLLVSLFVLHGVTFFPSELVALAGMALYGPARGVFYAWIGSMGAAYVAFGLARWIGRPIVERRVPPDQLARFDALIRRHGPRGLLILRLIPFVPFNAVNYACGLTSLSLWDYTWSTGLGILPGNVALGLLYRSSSVHRRYVFLALAALGLAALAVWAWRTARGQTQPKAAVEAKAPLGAEESGPS